MPNTPSIAGFEDFRGAVHHTAKWSHEPDDERGAVQRASRRQGQCHHDGLHGYADGRVGIAQATGRSTAEVRAERDARVPLRSKMGTGWDTAYAALFLASDEAQFITGEILRVDGGMGNGMG